LKAFIMVAKLSISNPDIWCCFELVQPPRRG
jgi:hypothetical protein